MTHCTCRARDVLASTEEIQLISESASMTAAEKLRCIRQVLCLRLQIEAEIWPALRLSPAHELALHERFPRGM